MTVKISFFIPTNDAIAANMKELARVLDSLESAIEEHNRRFTTGTNCDEYMLTMNDILGLMGLSQLPFS